MIYTLTLTIARPIEPDDESEILGDTAEWMGSAQAKRELEREVLRALRVLDGDCDAEVIDNQIEAE